jgi:hypothetical protein
VSSIRREGKILKVIIEHPTGGVLSLAAEETSLLPLKPPPQKGAALFGVKQLLMLSRMIEHRAIDVGLTSESGSHKKHDDQSPEKPENSPQSRRRALSKPCQSDSKISQQNSRHPNTTKTGELN